MENEREHTPEVSPAQAVDSARPEPLKSPENSERPEPPKRPKTLLHACCGPCTLEPSRILREEGLDITVYYATPTIWPREEYDRRGATLHAWADMDGLPVVDGEYDAAAWAEAVEEPTREWREAGSPADGHPERCRACYRMRLEAAAKYAVEHGYQVLSTTLSVSPYQHTQIIREELAAVCEKYGLTSHFEDFRPNYDEATRRSRALGMYRQNYCGCELSREEAAADRERIREERRAARAAEKAAFEEAHAEELAAAEAAHAARVAERRAYDEAQAKKRAILKELRQQGRQDAGA